MLKVSNYSELTHSVGRNLSVLAVAFGLSVSNYSELTHSVGLYFKKGACPASIEESFQLFRINPFGRGESLSLFVTVLLNL